MMKRILGGAAAAGLALSLLSAGSATAACSTGNTGPSSGETVVSAPPQTGQTTKVYKSQGIGGTSGYVGVSGNSGWIEANGSAAGPSGSIAGQTSNGAVDGRISGSAGSAPTVCVNGKP